MADLKHAVDDFRDSLEPRRTILSGWMFDFEDKGDPTVTGEPGYVYVLVDRGEGTGSGDVIKARSYFRKVSGWPVKIGTTRDRPWEYSVLEIDDAAMGGSLDAFSQLEPHSDAHEWNNPTGSDDVVYPRWLQLYDFGAWPGYNLEVTVADGVFHAYGTSAQQLDYQWHVDLAAYQPGGTLERWVTIYLTHTGTFEFVPGSPSGGFLGVEDIPMLPMNDMWAVAAVKLKGGQSTTPMTPGNEWIIDLRMAELGFPNKRHRVLTTDVSSPPTETELTGAFGTPGDLGNGFVGFIDDDGAGATVWLCAVVGGSWWYEQLSKAT